MGAVRKVARTAVVAIMRHSSMTHDRTVNGVWHRNGSDISIVETTTHHSHQFDAVHAYVSLWYVERGRDGVEAGKLRNLAAMSRNALSRGTHVLYVATTDRMRKSYAVPNRRYDSLFNMCLPMKTTLHTLTRVTSSPAGVHPVKDTQKDPQSDRRCSHSPPAAQSPHHQPPPYSPQPWYLTHRDR